MPHETESFHPLLLHAQFPGDQLGGAAHPLAVSSGVAVLDVDGLDECPDGGAVGGVLTVVLREDPAGDVHGQQDDQRGQRPVGAVPQDGHHQPGQRVHQVRPDRAGRQSAPGVPERHALGRDEDSAVQRGQHQAEDERGRAGREEGVRKVGARACRGAAERGGAAQEAVRPGGGAHGQGELSGPPDTACRGGRPLHPARERTGYGDEDRGGRRQQEGRREQQGKERSGTDRHGASEDTAAAGEFTGGVERGQQAEPAPGRAGPWGQCGKGAERGADHRAQDVDARCPRCAPHPYRPPPAWSMEAPG